MLEGPAGPPEVDWQNIFNSLRNENVKTVKLGNLGNLGKRQNGQKKHQNGQKPSKKSTLGL